MHYNQTTDVFHSIIKNLSWQYDPLQVYCYVGLYADRSLHQGVDRTLTSDAIFKYVMKPQFIVTPFNFKGDIYQRDNECAVIEIKCRKHSHNILFLHYQVHVEYIYKCAKLPRLWSIRPCKSSHYSWVSRF